jgi:bacterioferritin (cytochrome b1)
LKIEAIFLLWKPFQQYEYKIKRFALASEEDTYSSMFTALKHPIRRKILKILSKSQSTYTEILNQLNIDNGLLNYHLDNMADLITKNGEGRYRLSSFGEAAVGVTMKVEEAPEIKKKPLRLTVAQTTGIFLILVIGLASVTGLYIQLRGDYEGQGVMLTQTQEELDAANRRIERLTILDELANISEPATWTTSGIQITKGFPMSYTYQNLTTSKSINDDTSSLITFYAPVDGVVVHLELYVDPVNVNELDLTIQRGRAGRNETWVMVGTKGEYFNLTDTSNPTLLDTVWEAPVLWSLKTEGNGAYESPPLNKGWYTFSLFGPVIAYGPNSFRGVYVRYPSFQNLDSQLNSYRVMADFTLRNNETPILFAVSTDRY